MSAFAKSLALLLALCAQGALAQTISPVSGVTSVNRTMHQQLSQGRLVALGDVHGSPFVVQQLLDFLADEVNWQQVDDIAVEFGNQRYQALADRYILQGEALPLTDVRAIWRNTLYFMAWQYAVYEQLVVQLHEWNLQRSHKVRLVLTEPELDWQTLDLAAWQQHVAGREAGYQRLIEQQVIAKKHRAILLFGTFHLMKQPVQLSGRSADKFTSLVASLCRNYPDLIYVIWPRMAGDQVAAIADATPPYLLPLAGSSLGQIPLRQLTGRVAAQDDTAMAAIADAYLYLADVSRDAPPSAAAVSDATWQQELQRRAKILGGRSQQQITQWLQRYAH